MSIPINFSKKRLGNIIQTLIRFIFKIFFNDLNLKLLFQKRILIRIEIIFIIYKIGYLKKEAPEY